MNAVTHDDLGCPEATMTPSRSLTISPIVHRFRKRPIHTVFVDGERAWVDCELGHAIGFRDNGRRLGRGVRDHWCRDGKGRDFVTLDDGLRESLLRLVPDPETDAPLFEFGHALLFESALRVAFEHSAIIKRTDFAEWFDAHLAGPDPIRPAPAAEDDAATAEAQPHSAPVVFDARSLIAALRADREARADAIERAAETAHARKAIDGELLAAYRIAADEVRAGCPLPDLRPTVDHWLSPEELATALDVSAGGFEFVLHRAGLDLPGARHVRYVIDPFVAEVGVTRQFGPDAVRRARAEVAR